LKKLPNEEVSKTTIVSHLAKLYVDGQDFDLSQFVSEDEIASN
jgi:ATP-dependent DNA helicase RecQ